MKKDELKKKLESGDFYLSKEKRIGGGSWRLVDKRNGIACAGRINPRTAESLLNIQGEVLK